MSYIYLLVNLQYIYTNQIYIQEYDVLRIKFLGDCYYCVSGIPKPTDYHAKNCVDLGLEMIHIIKDVR